MAITTDEILVEFTGDLRETLTVLGEMVRGVVLQYPKPKHPWWDTGEPWQEFQSLIDRMNTRAPEGYFFGGHPTQPGCLGFWPLEETT